MGVSFRIGNAKPVFEKDEEFAELRASWEVEEINGDLDKLAIPHRTFFGNTMHFSYGGFGDFVRETNLHDVFYENGARQPYQHRGGHPGCVILRPSDYIQVKAALDIRKLKPSGPCGFWGEYNPSLPGKYEGFHNDWVWARLKIFEWWFKWALEICETPAIENF